MPLKELKRPNQWPGKPETKPSEAGQDCTVEEQEGWGRPAGDLCGATKALFSDICGNVIVYQFLKLDKSLYFPMTDLSPSEYQAVIPQSMTTEVSTQALQQSRVPSKCLKLMAV